MTSSTAAAATSPPDATFCDECHAKLKRRRSSVCCSKISRNNYGTPCASSSIPTSSLFCRKILCPTCATMYPLIVYDSTSTMTTTATATMTEDDWNDLSKNNTIQCFCKSCFQIKSVLDFTRTSQVMEPNTTNTNTSSNSMTTLLFAHGGGSSRAMFVPHAMEMCQTKGYRCILFDFPGHGSRMEEPLTLESCVSTVKNVLKEYNLMGDDEEKDENDTTNKKNNNNKNKIIYIGASFGAYVGFHILEQFASETATANLIQGAILLDCGQNVGPGASLKARMGLWVLNKLTNSMPSKTMMNLMLKTSVQSPADYKLVQSTFGAGFFFQQGTQQIECLKTVSPAECLQRMKKMKNRNSSSTSVDEEVDKTTKTTFPILYMNGSEDYRDSEKKWLEVSPDPEQSELHVYDKGDHFFCHDTRFVPDMLDRWDSFIQTKIL